MIKKVVLGFALALPLSVFACELPKGVSLKIGCSSDCDLFYRLRILTTAWGMGLSTKMINLQGRPDMKKAMSQVDGILIPGGADIDPKYYLDSVTPELRQYTKENLKLFQWSKEGERRDPFEYSLIKTYSQDDTFKDLPMLGICRGFQMMSVAQGIPLYLDIKTEVGIKNRRNLFDRIALAANSGSLISSLYSISNFKAYKLHHQGLRVPYYLKNQDKYPNAKVTAFSNDRKIAEAVEYTHRPALGVQYHPERSFTGTSAPVFRWFLTKACEYKTSLKEKK
jgi:putative glutamine amidotransferase